METQKRLVRRFFSKYRTLFVMIFLMATLNGFGQQVALKTNLLYDVSLFTPSVSAEFGFGKKHSLDVMGVLNFLSSNDKRLKIGAVQPEWRYWFCSRFNGWFLGAHAHGGQFNVGGYKFPFGFLKSARDHRYEGWFLGGGLGVGYQWALSKHWGVEAELGFGYTYLKYDKYKCGNCGAKEKSSSKGFWGPTRAAVSLIYIIK